MSIKFNFSTFLNKIQTKETKNSLFYLFLLLYVCFLIYLSNNLVIWEDESYSLHTSANTLTKVISLSYLFEGQPPVYFIILSLWRKINDGIFFARLLSILFTLLSAFVLHKTLKLIFKKIYSKWMIVLFLLNPFTVWASLEIRLPSLLILLSLMVIYLFYKIYFYNRPKLKIIFVLIGILGVYTQYYFVFLIISLSLLLLYSKGWNSFLNYCLWSMSIAIIFIPNLLFIREQYAMHQANQLHLTWHDKISYILDSPLQFLVNFSNIPLGRLGRWFMRIIFSLIFLVSFYKLFDEYKKQKYQDFKTLCEIFIPLISLLIIFTIIFLISNLTYSNHYLTVMFPFYCLLYSAFGIFKRKIKIIFFGTFVAYFIVSLTNNYYPTCIKVGDSKSVANYIHCIEHKNEPIFFRDKSLVLSFKPYYKGSNPLIPLPEIKFNYNYYQTELKDTTELKLLIKKNVANSESFLIINGFDQGFVSEKELSNIKMDNYLQHNYIITTDTTFNGKYDFDFLRVRRLYKTEK